MLKKNQDITLIPEPIPLFLIKISSLRSMLVNIGRNNSRFSHQLLATTSRRTANKKVNHQEDNSNRYVINRIQEISEEAVVEA